LQDVVVERQAHQAGEQGEPDVLARDHRPLAQRAALGEFDKVIQQVSAVQDGDGQQVDDRKTERQQGQKVQEPGRAELGRGVGVAGDGDRPGNVVHRGAAAEQAADHAHRIPAQLPGFAQCGRNGGQRRLAQRRVVGRQRGRRRKDSQGPVAARFRVARILEAARGDFERQPLPLAVDLDHGGAAADGLDQRADLVVGLHRRAVDGGDPVAFGEHAPGGGPRLDAADDRGQQLEARDQADGPHRLALVAAGWQARQRQAPVGERTVGGAHVHRDVAAVHCGIGHRHRGLGPGRRLAAVDRQQRVAAREPGLRRQALRLSDHRLEIGAADHEHAPQQRDAQQQVGDRPRGDDRDALAHGFVVERLGRLFRRHVAFALVEHAHVAAERDRGDRVFGAVAAAAHPQRLAEAHGEAQHAHAAAARDPVVAEFVESHQHAEADDHPPHGTEEAAHGAHAE
jgi:hypothetical protein